MSTRVGNRLGWSRLKYLPTGAPKNWVWSRPCHNIHQHTKDKTGGQTVSGKHQHPLAPMISRSGNGPGRRA